MVLLTAVALAPLAADAQSLPGIIAPGSGSIADAAGNVWDITSSGSIQENGAWVAGGGGTAALVTAGRTIYGLDASGKGWFTFGTAAQAWSPSAAPGAMAPTKTPTITAAVPGSVMQSPTSDVSVPSQTAAVSPLAQVGCGTVSTTNQYFGILPLLSGGPGRIVAPDGSVFVPRGIGIMEGQEPSVQTLQANFPSMTFARYAIYDYPAPAQIAPWVNTLTQAGIVVEIEDHNNGAGNAGGAQGSVFTGAALSNESDWYARTAAYFKSNALVWFGTNNEPPGPGAALSRWHLATYRAIRGTGNHTIIMIDPIGAYDVSGLDPSVYAQMSNVAWDIHFYGWGANYSTDAGTVKATLAGFIRNARAIKSAGGVTMPVIIGEYGDSTDGINVDPNGMLVVQAVADAITGGTAAGSAAWVWAPPQPGDGLVQNMEGGVTSPYGTTVGSYLKQAMQALSVCGKSTSATQDATAAPSNIVVVQTSSTGSDGSADTNTQQPTSTDAAAAAQSSNVAAQQTNDAADAMVQNATTALAKVPAH